MKLLFFLIYALSIFPSEPSKRWDIKISTNDIEVIKNKIESERVIRGIHLTSWVAGNPKRRAEILSYIKNSVINTVVVAVKEKNGEVYIPIDIAKRYGTYVPAIPQPESMINDFRSLGLYKIARIVCFHDDILPVKYPELAVKDSSGNIWKTRKGNKWVDPYNKNVWDYLIEIAKRSAEYGFDEIQFDYIRYPTEGDTKNCRYSKPHNRENATRNIKEFVEYAKKELASYGVKVSVDVFGLTTNSEMGIGQDLKMLCEVADRVYPMMYPSHYYRGEYNLDFPEIEPYKVVNRGLKEAMNMVGINYYKIVPYLQDFSIKVIYTPYHVRSQILAAKNNMIKGFVLWNPSSRYSWELLKPEVFCALIEPEKCPYNFVK